MSTLIHIDRQDLSLKSSLGMIYIYNDFILDYFCFSIELPWKFNRTNISCIPAGSYEYQKRWSDKAEEEVIEILDVFKRTNIEIHLENYAKRLLGCIAPGVGKHDIDSDGVIDVTNSRKAFESIMSITDHRGKILITNATDYASRV